MKNNPYDPPFTLEEIKAKAAQAIADEQAREFEMCLRVARRVAAKLYAGGIQYHNGGRVTVWVWVWHGDAVYGAADTLNKALAEIFKDSGLRVAGYSPGLFSITVHFDGLMP